VHFSSKDILVCTCRHIFSCCSCIRSLQCVHVCTYRVVRALFRTRYVGVHMYSRVCWCEYLSVLYYIMYRVRRPIGCLKLQVIFHTRTTKCSALFLKMTRKDKASYGSWPPCRYYAIQQCSSIAILCNIVTRYVYII